MSAGSVGPAGVKNLRAMFESKTSDHSTSPPSRGRSSPNGSISSAHSRPVSKVRSSFVAVERPGEAGQPSQWGLRKTSDVSSMAEVREEALMQDNDNTATPTATKMNGLQVSVPDGPGLGAILKGSPFEMSPVEPSDASYAVNASQPYESSAGTSSEQPKLNGNTNRVAPNVGKQTNSISKLGTDKDRKPPKSTPANLNTKTPTYKSKESPTLAKKSPVAQKKPQDSPTTTSGNGPAFKPRGGASKITGIIESAKKAQEEREKAEESTPTATNTGPSFKPRGGASKITGIIESAKKAQEEREQAEESTPTATSSGPAFKPRGGASKITGIVESAKKAQEERGKAQQSYQGEDEPPKEERKLSPIKVKAPSVASKQTAASRAHAQKKDSASPEAVPVKSPTSTRPTRLPSAATATTAASSARREVPTELEPTKQTSTTRRSINPQAPRVANAATKASLAKKSSRASLAGGEDRAKSRQSITPKPADEGFLARMTRPTASSAQRAHEKLQVSSPPRPTARRVSDTYKKPGRKSLNIGAKQQGSRPAPTSEEAEETVLEPVSETDPTAINGDDEGEPGPEVDESFSPQQAEVLDAATA